MAGVKRYELIKEGDCIAVCLSGGKDSMLLAKLMQALHKYSSVPFGLKFIVMNPGYNDENLQKIVYNSRLLNVPINIFESDIFEVVRNAGGSPCYLCARMRRGNLYSEAEKLGCNKIALGHHLSDVVETTLMGMLFGSQHQIMMPKLKSQNFPGMELIRPMYCVAEDAVLAWQRYNSLSFIACACPLYDEKSASPGKRAEVKALINRLKLAGDKNVEKSVFNSLHMLNLDTAIAYKKNGVVYSFLEDY